MQRDAKTEDTQRLLDGLKTGAESAWRQQTCWESFVKGCCRCCGVSVAVLLLIILILFIAMGPAGFTYYLAVLKIRQYGYGGAACMASDDDCRTAHGFPGSDTDSTVTWYEEQVRLMEQLPHRLETGEAYRSNELGNVRINDYTWPNIALGSNESVHSRLRPVYDALWAVGATTWSKESVRRSARDFIAQVNDTFTVTKDFSKWVELELHKITLGYDLTAEQLERFLDFQGSATMMIVLPEILNPVLRMMSNVQDFISTRKQLIQEYTDLIASDRRGVFDNVSASFRPTMASALVDSLTFAGGLSVPHALTSVFALMYSDQTPAGKAHDVSSLSNEEVERFVFEAVRLFSPVIEFPWMDAKEQRRKLMIQMKALRDPAVWGEHANRFSLKPLDTYHNYSGIGWVEPANGAEKKGHRWVSTPRSRGCPAQDLSLAMVVGFVQEWRSMQHEWHVAEQPEGGISFTGPAYFTPPVSSPFTLRRGT